MSAEDALLSDCAAKATALARALREDAAELGSSAERGTTLISAVAERLEKIAALASPTPRQASIISESSPSSMEKSREPL